MFKDDLGDRMKGFERIETARALEGALPIYARIDGRGFSKFTKGLRRPYDERMSMAMIEATKVLVDRTHARLGYTQSDEISLVWLADSANPLEQVMFGGKLQKLTSVLAGLATAAFTNAISKHEDEEFAAYADRLPHFDARVFQLPDKSEAANAFVWRENDARRNAVSMAAHDNFSPQMLHKRSVIDMIDMLADKGIVFDDYPSFFRQGSFVQRFSYERLFTEEELLAIPESKRPAPNTVITRSDVRVLETPPLRFRSDRIEFVFGPDKSSVAGPSMTDEESRGTVANETRMR